MTKPDGVAPDTNDAVSSSWGTWEELLLAFAVNRHGTASWDSIASELQKRTSDPNLSLTPHNCRSKYVDLKRRFILKNADSDGGDDKSNVEESLPLLEELRKLRVAELRREVQRYDLNIESLELKMKKMEEEQEKGEADLENDAQEKRDCEEPEVATAARTETAAAELEKDQLSVNESNSTDPGAEKVRIDEQGSDPATAGMEEGTNDRTEQTSVEPVELKSEPDSCNGSSNSIEEPDRKAKKTEAVAESEGESDGGGAEATKENSDVQSSASRSRKEEEGSDKVRRGSRSGEHEDQSRAVKELSAESQPLVDFLQAIRTPKLGCIFERRLRSQETTKYHKLILQHIDLETVETRLKQGLYSASPTNFFRDLLLLVNNALVFFTNNSPEAAAARQIRCLISTHISHKSDSSSGKKHIISSLPNTEEPEASPSLMLKPIISGSLIVCRKRSSIAAKATDKKKELTPLLVSEEKETKQQQLSGGDAEEHKITKKRTRDRFTKKSGKNSQGKQTSAAESGKQQQQGKGGSSSQQQAEAKGDSKKTQSTSDSKKRGAANFLNRIKQGSSSNNNGVLLDALKNTPLTTSESAAATGKKNENAKRGEKKEPPPAAAATRRSTEARQTKEKEKSSPGKRNVGRPPKRGGGAPVGKRGRDRGEAEAPAPKQTKKRSRKL